MSDQAKFGGDGMNHGRVEIPVPWPVTCHSEEKDERSPEAIRKAEQRARDAAAGVGELRVRLEPGVAARLALAQQIRGGQGEPYTATEYINTLILRDLDLLQQQCESVTKKICISCRKPLPRGCAGVWKGELTCPIRQLDHALML